MPNNRKLFTVTLWLLRAGIIWTKVSIVMMVLGVAIMIYWLSASPSVFDGIAHAMGPTVTADEYVRLQLALGANGTGIVTLLLLIFRALRRVVASASVGDPFIEANAVDLVRVAWLLLGLHVFVALMQPMISHFEPVGMDAKAHQTAYVSILLAVTVIPNQLPVLLIFVLAQVFRRGSDMRAELAGTI